MSSQLFHQNIFFTKELRYVLDGPGSNLSVGGVEIFLHSFLCRLVLRSTQPTIEISKGLSRG